MRELSIEKFIYQVKKELLEAQEKHKGESGYFMLQNVEFTITVVATYTNRGKLNLHVVQIGSDVAQKDTHSVKLSFRIMPEAEPVMDTGAEPVTPIEVTPWGPRYR